MSGFAAREGLATTAQPGVEASRPLGVVFDLGGVVFRWQPLLLLREVWPTLPDEAAARQAADAIFEGFRPGGDWAEFDRGAVDVPELVARLAARTGYAPQALQAFVEAIPPHLQPRVETVALMRRLKQAGHALYYLSNMPAPFADRLERLHPFFAWFTGGVFSARVQTIKPLPAIFEHARAQFARPPQELLFLDDMPVNVDAARRLGWQALHFEHADACEATMRERGWFRG